MNKRVLVGIGILLIGITVWLFGFKKPHFQISFSTPHPPGLVYHHLITWSGAWGDEIDSVDLLVKTPYNSLAQQIFIKDSVFSYNWEIESEKEGQSRVKVLVKDKRNAYSNYSLLRSNAFKQRNTEVVTTLARSLQNENERFKVHSIKDTVTAPIYCAYVSASSPIRAKATTMLSKIGVVMNYLKSNDIELAGDPFLSVTQWNEFDETIEFDFCFPIQPSDSLPTSTAVQFKTFDGFRALKASFNGNYKDSHYAWYYLLDYSNYHNKEIVKQPVEMFLNDPHIGGNPLEWEAHILLPLAE